MTTTVRDTPTPDPALPCPVCKVAQPAGTRFCPNDGTPLGETAAGSRAELTPTGGRRPATVELTLPAVVGGRYRLDAVRGGGGMAKVYRATDVTLDREVAVKLINPELRSESEFDARFQREAKIASQLSDPHIVVVHDFGLDADHGPYLVMEYLHGQSLRERLSATGKMPLKAVLQIAGQMFLALIHAHEKGIVHRDVKPDNIFLVEQSGVRLHVRVLDFGIARIYRQDDASASQTITHAGAVLGTPRYMSPEQLAGKTVDARTDIHSAALVLFEALTGTLPYAQSQRLCDLCPDVPPGFQELIEQCLKPSPADRPASAVEVYLRLQELGKASGVLLLPPGAMSRLVAARNADAPTQIYTPPAPPPSRRKWLGWVGGAAGVAALAGLAWYAIGTASYPAGPESLHGIKIGDNHHVAEEKLSLSRIDTGNPWKVNRLREFMGNVLRPADLGLSDAELDKVVVRRTADDRVVVLCHADRIVALVSTHRTGSTNRRVSVYSSAAEILSRYDDHRATEIKDIDLRDGGHAQTYRYDVLGLGFEVQKGKIASVTLYPAAGSK